MLQLTDDTFHFSAEPTPKAGIDRLMDLITEDLGEHLGKHAVTDHVCASMAIEDGSVHVTLTALTSFGRRALKRFTGEEVRE